MKEKKRLPQCKSTRWNWKLSKISGATWVDFAQHEKSVLSNMSEESGMCKNLMLEQSVGQKLEKKLATCVICQRSTHYNLDWLMLCCEVTYLHQKKHASGQKIKTKFFIFAIYGFKYQAGKKPLEQLLLFWKISWQNHEIISKWIWTEAIEPCLVEINTLLDKRKKHPHFLNYTLRFLLQKNLYVRLPLQKGGFEDLNKYNASISEIEKQFLPTTPINSNSWFFIFKSSYN